VAGVYGKGPFYGVSGFSANVGVHAGSNGGTGLHAQTHAPSNHAAKVTNSQGRGLAGSALFAEAANATGIAVYAINSSQGSTDATAVFSNSGQGMIVKGFGGNGGSHEFAVHNDGTVWTAGGIEIAGGADISERFDVALPTGVEELLPGMVVAIDPANPGGLAVTTEAYETRVAGIVSGAGGVKTGMLLGHDRTAATGASAVALTGRVYCLVDCGASGPIQPGDMLTTSDVPGHAMKATDRDRSFGAIIGKAMTGLESGRGLVLVLVSLQ
jgi:hypothetical protein